MARAKMIEMLMMSNGGNAEQKAQYKVYLEAKSDLELQNMVAINFF